MTLPNQTVCGCSHGLRQDRPPGLMATGGLAAWDSSAATLLLQFLLSLPSSVSRSHPHSPLPDPVATTQTPWDWPDNTLFQQHIHPLSTHGHPTLQDLIAPAVTQCHVYKFEVMAQLIANMYCNCPKENDNKPNTNKYTKSRASSLTKYTHRPYASKSCNVIKTNPGGAKRITVTLKTAKMYLV